MSVVEADYIVNRAGTNYISPSDTSVTIPTTNVSATFTGPFTKSGTLTFSSYNNTATVLIFSATISGPTVSSLATAVGVIPLAIRPLSTVYIPTVLNISLSTTLTAGCVIVHPNGNIDIGIRGLTPFSPIRPASPFYTGSTIGWPTITATWSY